MMLNDPSGRETPKPGSTNYAVMTMTDSQLIGRLKSMSAEQRGAFLGSASGAFAVRANAAASGMRKEYTLPALNIEAKKPEPRADAARDPREGQMRSPNNVADFIVAEGAAGVFRVMAETALNEVAVPAVMAFIGGRANTPTSADDPTIQNQRTYSEQGVEIAADAFVGKALGRVLRHANEALGPIGRRSQQVRPADGAKASWTDFLLEAKSRNAAFKKELGVSDDILAMGEFQSRVELHWTQFGLKASDTVPKRVPSSWTAEEIEDAIEIYTASIATRQAENAHFAAQGGGVPDVFADHVRRVADESKFVEKLTSRLEHLRR